MSDLTSKGFGLPISIPSGVLDNNPRFGQLLHTLAKHIDLTTTASSRVNREFQEAKEQLRIEKEGYLRNYLLYQEIKNFVLDGELALSSKELSGSGAATAKPFDRVKKAVEYAELYDYCHENEGEKALLGITPDVLKQRMPTQLSFTDKEYLANSIVQQLECRCKKLLRAYYLKPVADDELLTKMTQLPTRLEMDQRTIEVSRQEIKQLKKAYQWQMEQYRKSLLAAVGILQDLIQKFRLHGPSEHNRRHAELMAVKVEAFTLKLRLVQLEVLNDTYTPETTSALKNIRAAIEDKSMKTKQQITDVSCDLNAYEILGSEFVTLVAEYKQLQSKIDTNKWAIDKVENKS